MKYETVCGLEIHTELSTKTKIFCSCTTGFGGGINSHCCEVCTGMPGTLPVLNERVVEYAVRLALALGCDITRRIRFDRKNYFYPDLPKAYQISQLYLPICRGGGIDIADSVNGGTKRVRIHEIHMEEDAGKLLHRDGATLIDYNRAGVPLLEIVTEPDLSNGAEAAELAQKLRTLLRFIGISDCKMQEGSLRADVNVSVREQGSSELGTRTEMKNLASFKAIKQAVDTEAERQIAELEKGNAIVRQTRRWDEKENKSYLMRAKESADDYKYFPEPDIPPICISDEYIENIRRTMPELPEDKMRRFLSLGLTEYDTEILCSDIALANLFDSALEYTNLPRQTAKLIMGEVMMLLKETQTLPESITLKPEHLAEAVTLPESGKITRDTAKKALREAFINGVRPLDYVKKNNLEICADAALIEDVCRRAVSENPKAVTEYLQGKEKSFNFLVGQAMRMLGGRASPADVRAKMQQIIAKK